MPRPAVRGWFLPDKDRDRMPGPRPRSWESAVSVSLWSGELSSVASVSHVLSGGGAHLLRVVRVP